MSHNVISCVEVAALVDMIRMANFNCQHLDDLLMYEKADNTPLRIAPILEAAALGHLSTVKTLLAEGTDASLRYGGT